MDNNYNNNFFDDAKTESETPQGEVTEVSFTVEDVLPDDVTEASTAADAELSDDVTVAEPEEVSADESVVEVHESYEVSGDFYEEAEEKKPAAPWKLVICTALITSIVTAAICGAFYMFTSPKNQSTIIYRDGNDLRSKVDLMTALGLDEEKPLSVTAIANRVGPTVVGIAAKGTAAAESIFGIIQQPFSSSGTGFIISTDGYVVTNNHVIAGATEIIVTLDNDSEYTAKVIGKDEKTDLAVLKIDAKGLTPAVLGSSSNVQVGEVAVAIGNPLGQTLSGTVTAGIISATNRKVTVDGNEYTLLQTDAAINSGNSGGPLANVYGEIIGINNAKIAASGVEGLGFAIPSDIAKPIIEDLIAVGYVRGRPLIGINGRNITEEISTYYDLPIGIYVVSVVEFSAAEKAGLQIGDVITHCNGKKIKTVDELNEIRDEHAAGDTLNLQIVRSGKTMDIAIILGEDRPSVSLN